MLERVGGVSDRNVALVDDTLIAQMMESIYTTPTYTKVNNVIVHLLELLGGPEGSTIVSSGLMNYGFDSIRKNGIL